MFIGAPTIDLAAGAAHSCALLRSGEVRCWGADNDAGSLGYPGIGRVGGDQHPAEFGPVFLAEELPVAITSGEKHTAALTAQGRFHAWASPDLSDMATAT